MGNFELAAVVPTSDRFVEVVGLLRGSAGATAERGSARWLGPACHLAILVYPLGFQFTDIGLLILSE